MCAGVCVCMRECYELALADGLAQVTVVLVRAVGMAVDRTGLPVRGPARVGDAKVCAQHLVQVK